MLHIFCSTLAYHYTNPTVEKSQVEECGGSPISLSA